MNTILYLSFCRLKIDQGAPHETHLINVSVLSFFGLGVRGATYKQLILHITRRVFVAPGLC